MIGNAKAIVQTAKTYIGPQILIKLVSGIKDTEKRKTCLALNAEEFNVDKMWLCAALRNERTKMKKNTQESILFIKNLTISKIREGILLKDDIQRVNLPGFTVEMTVIL